MEHEHTAVRRPRDMSPARLEAFSDGVMAVIITIMVLELRPPDGVDFNSLEALVPNLLVYVLSFTSIGIYWNNHHHLLRATRRISGGVMWANLYLLLWLSLIPVVTAWVGAHHESTLPAAAYGFVGIMSAIAFTILTIMISNVNKDARLNEVLGSDLKGRVSLALYAVGMAVAFFQPLLAYIPYALVSIIWFIPDRRFATAGDGKE
jgi:uncharacterized membrane protein